MTPQSRLWLKRILLTLICAIPILTIVQLIGPLRQRLHTEERIDPGGKNNLSLIEQEHVARYEFAKQYCAGKTVADIASGTGYGMDILRSVAKSVDGYDIQPLGQEFIIDLDKQSWSRHYDVIVSFETLEHLANPEFFLANVKNTAGMLILSTPLNERKGWANPHHKQVWTDESIKTLLARYFACEYFYQYGPRIQQQKTDPERILIAVCTP